VQLSKSYAPFKEQCVGILGGCCGMSFDHTTLLFSHKLGTLVLFPIRPII
jgi:methionine synthase I (cobalamin-dependent)